MAGNEQIRKASAPGAFEESYGDLNYAGFTPVEDPESAPTVVPFGLDRNGRVQANAGQEGAQAVHEQRTQHTGRIVAADEAPDYSGCYKVQGRNDET